jgi:hypothetical protein
MYDEILDRANKFFENHTFEVYYLFDSQGEPIAPTNVKIKLTGVKDLISMGDFKPFITYTAYILPSNEQSDKFNSVLSTHFGSETVINTFDRGAYSNFEWVMTKKLSELLKYFSLPEAVLTKVVNQVEPMKINENLIVESKVDGAVRKIVKDILDLIKFQRNGEFILPEDVRIEDNTYKFSNLPEFTIELEVIESDVVDRFDVECGYYKEEEVITVDIVINPDVRYTVLYDVVGELNEQIRHELEHMIQNARGEELPKKEPKSPSKYYSQPHEIGAQVAGFKRKAKITKQPYEKVVRQWFEENKHKHRLNPKQSEKIIQKLLDATNGIRKIN